MSELNADRAACVRRCTVYLLEEMAGADIAPYLYQDHYLSARELEEIQMTSTRYSKNEILLRSISGKSNEVYSTFFDALISTDQAFIADYVMRTGARKRSESLDRFCSYGYVGCTFVGDNVAERKEHESREQALHLQILQNRVVHLKGENEELRNDKRRAEDTNEQLTGQVLELEEEIRKKDRTIKEVREMVERKKLTVEGLTKKILELRGNQNDQDQGQGELVRLSIDEPDAQAESGPESPTGGVFRFPTSPTKDPDPVAVEGRYEWTLTNMKQIIAEAKSTRGAQVCDGPVFKCCSSGYKLQMVMRIHGNGDIQLGLYILRGRHDASRTWPFCYAVSADIYKGPVKGWRPGFKRYTSGDVRSLCHSPALYKARYGRPMTTRNEACFLGWYSSADVGKKDKVQWRLVIHHE